MDADLIDRIYECSVVPELWPRVLDDVAELSGARGGLLFSARKVLNWTASDCIRDTFDAYVNDGWFAKCSRRVCLMGQAQPGFFTEYDFWTPDQLDENPIYRDFFRPRGLGWSAGTGLQIPTGDNIVFSMEREFIEGPFDRGGVERLNALRPHLSRSALITARLGLERAKGASELLTSIGLPAVLIDEAGTAIEANQLVEAIPNQITWRAQNRISFADDRANDLLADALSALQTSSVSAARTFPLRDEDDRAAMVVHVIPIRRSAHEVFARSYALLVLTPVAASRGPSIDLLKSLFDLTASEARVARRIATGDSLDQIALAGGVAIGTVRSQLKRVFEKTGCTRQAEIAALLSSVVLDRSAEADIGVLST